MILKSLELENIRSYKKEKIVFEKGINFLSGDIGSGKSTILLSIEFALFGFKKGDLEGFHLLRKGEREGCIKLIIENENSLIEIFRKIKRSKSNDIISQENGYIKFDENILDLAPSEINAYIFDIFNFPKEFLTKDKNLIYRFTIYTAQEQLKEIIFAENEKRLEVIRKIFGIDKYKQLKDAISIYLTKLREDKKLFQVKLEPFERLFEETVKEEIEIDNLIESLEKADLSEKNLTEKIKKYDDAILKREEFFEKLVEKILQIEKKLSEIEQIEKNINVLNKELELKNSLFEKSKKIDYVKLNDQINLEIKSHEEKIKEIFLKKKEMNEKIILLDQLKIEKDNLLKIINEIEIKKQLILSEEKNIDLKKIQEEIEKSNLELDTLKKNNLESDLILKLFENQKEEEFKLKFELEAIENKIEESKKSVHEALNIDSCPTCLQKVSKEHKDSLHLKIKEENKLNILKKEKINKDLIEFKEKINLTKKKIEIMEKANNEISLLEMRIKNLNEKKIKEEKIKLNIENLMKNIFELEKTNPKLRYDKIILELSNEKVIREKIEDLNKIEKEIQGNIFNYTSKFKENTQKLKEIESLSEDIEQFFKKITLSNLEIEKKQLYLDKLLEYKENEKKIKEEKIKLSSSLLVLKKEEKEINTKIASDKASLKLKKEICFEKKEKLKELDLLKIQYQKLLEDEIFLSSSAVNISESIERVIFTKYYAEFCQRFEIFFRELIEDNNIEIRLDDEFTPIIEQNGYDIDVKNLSGGEKSSLAISYRLALKEIIENNISSQKLSLLILDEPTDGFSREQIDRLGNILREINLEQILIVSHDEKIESISDKVFYIEKINHESKIKMMDGR